MGLVFLLFGIGAAWPRRQPDADEVQVDAERGWLDPGCAHSSSCSSGSATPTAWIARGL
jgi:hypothetical protein